MVQRKLSFSRKRKVCIILAGQYHFFIANCLISLLFLYLFVVQQHRVVEDTNYCVVKFSLPSEAGSIVKVLKAFPVSLQTSCITIHNTYK